MFIHSVKVHRIYKTAAKIVKQVQEDGKGVKQLLFEQTHVNIKTLNALVFETLKHARILDLLIQRTSLLFNEPRLDPWLARVLITELLWGKKDKLVSEAKPIKTIISYSKKLQAVLRDLSVSMPEPLKEALTTPGKHFQAYHPRYVRVNTLTMTIQEAVDGFRDEGWTLVRHGDDWTYKDFLKAVSELQPQHFIPDFHIPELFVFPPDTQFHEYQCYMQGHIVLQDKASCMAAHLLAPEPGSNVLDMCAAPGMKTTHLAAMIGNKGTIYAVEKDERRYGVLENIIQATNSTCVKTINSDALKITNEQCPDVEYILVDPSCSGTGMLGRIDPAGPTKQDLRLVRLSGFQILILRRALTAFPKAKRVLYSTCSTMTQENEQVVKEVLETTKQFRLVPSAELLKKDWLSFGSKEYQDIGEKCLYSKSDVDYTNGFFMAVFERIAPYDENDVYVKGKKWKDIKQEPEDFNDTDDKGEMVNYDVTNDNMRLQAEEVAAKDNEIPIDTQITKVKKKKIKKERQEITEDAIDIDDNAVKNEIEIEKTKTKKEKIKKEIQEEPEIDIDIDTKKKKKKSKKHKEENVEELDQIKKNKSTKEDNKENENYHVDGKESSETIQVSENSKSKKKKKKDKNSKNISEPKLIEERNDTIQIDETKMVSNDENLNGKHKKKKCKKCNHQSEMYEDETQGKAEEIDVVVSKKKSKKSKIALEDNVEKETNEIEKKSKKNKILDTECEENEYETVPKKKKHKKSKSEVE